MKALRITSIILGTAISAASLRPAAAQTMFDALVQAYHNNPTLLADRARLRATDEGVSQALANWRPSLTFSGDYGKERNEADAGFTSGVTVRDPNSFGFTAQQNLYRGGRTLAATRRAENLVRADRARLAATEQTVLLDAATAYVDVVRDQAVVNLNRNNERVLARQLEAARDRFRVGEVTRTDVAQAESRMARAVADRIDAQSRLVQSRAAYKNVVGELPGKLSRARPLGDLPGSEKDAIAAAQKNSFAVVQADFNERAAKAQVREVVGELLPFLNLSGQFRERRNTIGASSKTDSFSVTARVTVPLYQSGAVSSRVRAAKQTVGQRRNELNQAVRDSIEAGTRAWEALETARAQIRSFTAEVRATSIALEGVQQEALVGSRTVLDVLDAEQEALDARVNLTRAQRDEVVATFELRAAVGELTAQKLNIPVTPYDPVRHYDRVRGKWFGIQVDKE